MKRIIDFVRSFCISIEFCILLLAIVVCFYKPNWANECSEWLLIEAEALKWLFLLPLGSLVWVLKEIFGVLFPDGTRKDCLDSWPDYWRLRVVCDVAVAYAIIFGLLGLSVWSNPSGFFGAARMLLLFIAVLGSSVVALSVYEAKTVIRETLAGRKLTP
jgi:hypothetical protein